MLDKSVKPCSSPGPDHHPTRRPARAPHGRGQLAKIFKKHQDIPTLGDTGDLMMVLYNMEVLQFFSR